ncbi:MAG: outer membrane protein assembly factor BamB family protein [Propionibacteriaceae bacterium]
MIRTEQLRRGLMAVAVVAALLTASCTSDAPPDSPPSPGPPRIDEPASLPELTIADKPRWGNAESGVDQLDTITFVDEESAVVRGYTEESDFPQLYVVDVQTGKTRWSKGMLSSLDDREGLSFMSTEWAVAGAAGEEVVLATYYAENCVTEPCPEDPSPESGVVGLSIEDGSVQWMHPTIPSVAEGDPKADQQKDQTLAIVAAGNGGAGAPAVVVGPTMAMNGNENAPPEDFRTVVLDPATGQEAWAREGVIGQRGAGDLLLATVPPEGQGRDNDRAQGGPVALDLADGTERWNVADEHTDANLLGTTEHTLLIANVLGGAIGGYQVLDLADGSVLHDLGTKITNPVVSSGGDDLVVGTSVADPYSLASVTPDDEGPLFSEPLESIPRPTFVAAGYVLLTDSTDDSTTALDRSGNILGTDLPGTPVLLSEDVLVLRQGSGLDSTFGVYERN